ncbi:hypothetical protein LCGC14_2810020, partial [marine sediment metagenome]
SADFADEAMEMAGLKAAPSTAKP